MVTVNQYESEKAMIETEDESSDRSECSERHKLIIICRAIAFTLLMLQVVFGPAYKQILKGKSNVLPAWQMYHTRGIGICDVEFYIRHPDGRIEHIDHFKTLEYDKLLKLHHHSRRIRGEKGVSRVGQRIRQKVGATVDLRVNARIGTRDGWKTLYVDKRIE